MKFSKVHFYINYILQNAFALIGSHSEFVIFI